jgi:hypothetical protein
LTAGCSESTNGPSSITQSGCANQNAPTPQSAVPRERESQEERWPEAHAAAGRVRTSRVTHSARLPSTIGWCGWFCFLCGGAGGVDGATGCTADMAERGKKLRDQMMGGRPAARACRHLLRRLLGLLTRGTPLSPSLLSRPSPLLGSPAPPPHTPAGPSAARTPRPRGSRTGPQPPPATHLRIKSGCNRALNVRSGFQ